jgi:integrase
MLLIVVLETPASSASSLIVSTRSLRKRLTLSTSTSMTTLYSSRTPDYKLQIRENIVPAFGTMKLSKLDTPNIQALYSAKLHDGLKPSSVRYIHAVLHRALSTAVELRLIARNPAASADPPKVHHEEITPLIMDQTRVFLDAACGQKYEALYVLSLTCGLRMGESLGLKWSDIDLDAGTLRVNRQLQRIMEGGGLVFSEPKNASRRTIDLPQRALEALRTHRKPQAGGEEAQGG